MSQVPTSAFAWRTVTLASGLLAMLAIGAARDMAAAQSSQLPAGSPGRFTMHPTDGGVLRMDTQTGALSMCKQASGTWTCAMTPDDRVAVEAEMQRLKAENTELKNSVKRLEDLAGLPPGAEPDGKKRQSGVQLPTEEDVDKALTYVQKMMKKFREKLRELEGEEKRGTAS